MESGELAAGGGPASLVPVMTLSLPAEAHAALRARVAETDAERAARVRILYGGSAKPANMGGFLEVSDVDGLLIGGASLDPAAFAAMIGYAPAG